MKKIIVCTGTDDQKNIRVRLSLIADEGMPAVYLSRTIAPGESLSDARTALEANISKSYEQNGIPGSPWPKIPDEEWAEAEEIVSVLHTPERIAKRKALDNEMTLKVTRK